MAIVDGGAMNLMNSFARLGVVWSGGHEGLMTNVLRGEWGMKGLPSVRGWPEMHSLKVMDCI